MIMLSVMAPPLDFPAHQSVHCISTTPERFDMETVLLTTLQLAKRLGLAPITLQIWRSQGVGIPYVRQGTRVFYRLALDSSSMSFSVSEVAFCRRVVC